MKKFFKWFIGLAAVGSAIGLIIAYFCKGRCDDSNCDGTQDFTEEDDFDLDSDLQPVGDREYVPLKRTPEADSDEQVKEAPSDDKEAEAVETPDTEEKTEE